MGGKADWKVRLGIDGVANVITGFNSVLMLFDRAWSAVRQMSETVEQYTSVTRNHRVSVEEASQAVRQQVDVIELHRAAVRTEQAGLRLSEQQFRSLVVAATQYADATGTDATQAIERLTSAVVSGTTEGLRPFGIHLREAGSIASRQQRAIDELTRRFRDQTVEATSLNDAMDRLKNTWRHAWTSMAAVLQEESGLIMQVVNQLADGLQDIANAMETLQRSRRNLAENPGQAELMRLQREAESMGYSFRDSEPGALVRFGGVGGDVGRGVAAVGMAAGSLVRGDVGDAVIGIAEGDARTRARANAIMRRRDQLLAQEARGNYTGREGEQTAPPLDLGRVPSRRGGGGGGGGEQLGPWGMTAEETAAARQYADVSRIPYDQERALDAVADVRRRWAEEQWAEEQERIDRAAQARVDAATEQGRLEREAKDHTRQLADERMQSLEQEAQRWQELKTATEEYEEAQERASSARLKSAFGGISDTLSELAGATRLAGQLAEEMGGKHSRAAEVIAKVEGGLWTAYHGFKVVSQIAEAAEDFARGLPGVPEGIAHLAAATAHGVAAAKAAADLGGGGGGASAGTAATAPGGAGASAPSAGARPEYLVRESRAEDIGTPSVVVEVHGVITSERAVQEIEAAMRAANRRRR